MHLMIFGIKVLESICLVVSIKDDIEYGFLNAFGYDMFNHQ